jgi:hypothetical protein
MNQTLLHWLPYRLIEKNQEYFFEWLYLGENRFQEAFFEETILKSKSLPENSKRFKVISQAEVVLEWSRQINCIQPTAFIFHVSRCGSTMLSQVLTESKTNIVVPEPPRENQQTKTLMHSSHRDKPRQNANHAGISLVF